MIPMMGWMRDLLSKPARRGDVNITIIVRSGEHSTADEIAKSIREAAPRIAEMAHASVMRAIEQKDK